MLDAALKAQLKIYLNNVSQPIGIGASDDAARTPSFTINRPGDDTGIRFAGIPLGHEFTSLVLVLLHVGGHPPKA